VKIARSKFSPANISIVYLYVVGFAVFWIWIPELWINWTTHKSVLNIDMSTKAIVAVGLVAPLLTNTFDLSIAGVISLSSVMVSWLQTEYHWNMWPAMALTLAVALVCGAANALLVVGIRINSFIATLASGAVITAIAEYTSGGVQVQVPNAFKDVAKSQMFWGVTAKVGYLAIIAVIMWYVLEHTPAGRYMHATGAGPDAARLAGVQTSRYVVLSLVVCSFVAGFGGIVSAAQTAGNAQAGAPYLLPAFAACFLGSTQFRGRFNVWGTVASVFVLASLVAGLQRSIHNQGIRRILDSLFFGLALIAAVGLSKLLERYRERTAFRMRALEINRISEPSGHLH
jgi:ribose transport system permease protein